MPEITSSKYLVPAGWDHAPHLKEKDKQEMRNSTPSHLIDAREKGLPSLGSGAIYPYERKDVEFEPTFRMPPHWAHLSSLDVGWKRTACLWGAHDKDSDIVYVWSEHYKAQAEPPIHADAIKARGEWIPTIFDTAARGRSQEDGNRLSDSYSRLGLSMIPAIKAVEAGLYEVQQRLCSGRLKIACNLPNFWFEYGLYRRDVKGNIIKENDHLMDCLRYLIMSITSAIPQPFGDLEMRTARSNHQKGNTGY